MNLAGEAVSSPVEAFEALKGIDPFKVKSEVVREALWRAWAKDPILFAVHCWHIRHPAHGAIRFDMTEPQKEAIRHWQENRYSLTLKARQIGWSTVVAYYQVWLCLFKRDQVVIDISRTEREAISLLKKSKYGYIRLPDWVRKRVDLVQETQEKMVFSNGSQITSMPSASDPARGESASLVVVDEWAFLPNAEEAWASIEPVADVGGRVIGLSTANGWGNWFHEQWVASEEGRGLFALMFHPWHAAKNRQLPDGSPDWDWYNAKYAASTQKWLIHQEYPTTPEEAFIKSGNPVFDPDALERHTLSEPALEGELWSPYSKVFEFRTKGNGSLHVWEKPKEDGLYVVGADVAEGLEHGDFSSAHVINAKTGDVVAHWHGHIPAYEFADVLYNLGGWYGFALLGVEVNNHGLTTVTKLRQVLKYPRLWRRQSDGAKVKITLSQEYGWKTTKVTKGILIDGLGEALAEGISVPCRNTMRELRTYVRDGKGGFQGSPHDDRVISLALAVQMLDYVHETEYAPKVDDYMTGDWWERQGMEDYFEARPLGWHRRR